MEHKWLFYLHKPYVGPSGFGCCKYLSLLGHHSSFTEVTCICIILSLQLWISYLTYDWAVQHRPRQTATSARQDCPAGGRVCIMHHHALGLFWWMSQQKIREFNLILRNAWAWKLRYIYVSSSWNFMKILIDFESRLCLTNASSALL